MHPKALVEACTELVRLTLKFDHPADSVVSKFFRDYRKTYAFGPRERAALAETTYNVLRNKLRYDHFAPSGSGPKERRLAILGFAQHLKDQAPANNAPKSAKHANNSPLDFLFSALNKQEAAWLEACEAVSPADLMERHRHNMPEWLVEPLKAQVGEGFWPLVERLNGGAPLDLRVNTFTDKRADVQHELKLAGIKAVDTPFSPWGLRIEGKPALSGLDAFARGAIEVQDEGSQLLALLLDAKRGEMVVDFCAGAGGKTLAIGASMRSTGRLYAFDTSGHRLESLKPRLARSKLSNVHPSAIAHERDERVKRLSGKIDRVLVDAPCSGLGTLRRNPDLKWRQSPKAVEELTVKQTSILASAARLVKSGGRLVYATCSVLPEENEAIAQAFSAAHPNFVPLSAADTLTELKVANAGSLCTTDGLYLRLWPHIHATDGFFAAVWVAK
ncbi:MAG: SAM-dependent methyltransferase [Burkholderiales bacterium 35-55-47]|jgi:16S rRNA (cytosine967-C5)-methyltransferase|uniref:RsmB/NOP family class I SAM-dependent RNA methyltransferase n=1 Tax=Limnohabitans sp. TaxID=1907725 RepID=UPI000BDDCA10|nr:RsmB/NOP family class I SAM-dependent RNA methyltransferase [Limnohabitans sp.]OYY20193.1 MAG: SAM-dependent methyltransferase [Burkholderiales bacterium 35-55-47]OYZ74195.1 MAG: SAM-dependent methyltransferase [Burkholderiales bacterium 24-55-52]OZB01913.1 MAG: SAM-dependent methyltransferase [Burkholderiales bacterium 39-55-53]HQR86439.1 RsmB/NOP family class I SAM-dependent RNA methyltransferase [Limnohabitans sp.]HQS25644.1 RsmB/NOP family class I SAM-dependent RNA methyltransferase [Li